MLEVLSDILEHFGVPKSVIILLLASIIAVFVVLWGIRIVQWAIVKNRQWKLNESLSPFISDSDVEKATRYYVNTRYQNVSPSADEEPGRTHIAAAKGELVPLFRDDVFKRNDEGSRYYLILADTGMGKTTFLINLFMRHTVRPFHNLIYGSPTPPIKLFPLGSPDIWDAIEKIENKIGTILLLDAFDEDVAAVEDHEKRMLEILELTKGFLKVIVTCRTQFFPSDKEIPDDTGYVSFGPEQNPFRFQRVYLSVFDERDIAAYLRKRFSFYQRRLRKKAESIVNKSPNLVMRPMLLSYINDLVEEDRSFEYSYEVYEVLVCKWIERESKKRAVTEKFGSPEKYAGMLHTFSRALAVNLYEKREERGGYFIRRTEFVVNPTQLHSIGDIEEVSMSETDIRTRSLLNRDAEGRYKFSHKSIMEYFLACELRKNYHMLRKFDFDGMSATEAFLEEMISDVRYVGGYFSGAGQPPLPFELIGVRDLSYVERISIHHFGKMRPEDLELFPNAQTIVLLDVSHLKVLYYLELLFNLDDVLFDTEIGGLDAEERARLFKDLTNADCNEVRARLVNARKIGATFYGRLQSEELFAKLSMHRDFRSHRQNPEWYNKIVHDADFVHKQNILDDVVRAEKYLRRLKRIRKAMPNCEIVY